MVGSRSVDLVIMSLLSGESIETLMSSRTAQALGALLIRDGLTGLYNQNYFERRLSMLLESPEDTRAPVALIVVGLDSVRQINDALGPAVGDQLIITAAREVAAKVHISGYVARSGDRVLVALPGKSEEDAEVYAQWLRDALTGVDVKLVDGTILKTVHASFGVAEALSGTGCVAQVLSAADRAMRYARIKKTGVGRLTRMGESAQAAVDAADRATDATSRQAPVTFLTCQFGNTSDAQRFQPDTRLGVEAEYCTIIANILERSGGLVFRLQNRLNRVYAAFGSAGEAVSAASAVARLSVGVRMGLYTSTSGGTRNEDAAFAIARCGQLACLANDGQALLSEQTAEVCRLALTAEVELSDLGVHRLRDLYTEGRIFGLYHPELRRVLSPPRSVALLPNNLPLQATSFIGREREMAEVRRLLSTNRLVTLTGPGGSGKTRLALQVAAELLDSFADGVWYAGLAALRDPAQVLDVVASAVGLRGLSEEHILDMLADHLATKSPLLVLDNCEHLLPAVRHLVSKLLVECPKLRVLATSHEPLNIADEAAWSVPGLTVPDAQKAISLDSLTRYDGVRLFLERIHYHRPDFALGAENANAVLQICHRLDGLALALELAAPQIKTLTPAELLPRLDERFQILVGQERADQPRHQTLRALADWSYDLLSESEQKLWCRLSVFAGSFPVEAAEFVGGVGGIEPREVAHLVAQLVEKSLVAAELPVGTRFRLLETMRVYALEKLHASGEIESLRSRHCDWYLSLLEGANLSALDKGDEAWLDRLETEHENMWAAMQWSHQRNDSQRELRFLQGLTPIWFYRRSEAGQEWLNGLLVGASRDPNLKARVLLLAGSISFMHGQYDQTSRDWKEALELYGQTDDSLGRAKVLTNMGFLAELRGNIDQAIAFWGEAAVNGLQVGWRYADVLLEILNLRAQTADARRLTEMLDNLLSEPRDPTGTAGIIWYASGAASAKGEYAWSADRLIEAERIYRSIHFKGKVALVLAERGHLARLLGDLDQARELFSESLALFKQLGGRLKEGEADALEGVAALQGAQGDPIGAARLFGAVERLREEAGLPVRRLARERYEADVSAVRAQLTSVEFDDAWSEGHNMRLPQAVTYALGQTTQTEALH